jgi:hypothetical protein
MGGFDESDGTRTNAIIAYFRQACPEIADTLIAAVSEDR